MPCWFIGNTILAGMVESTGAQAVAGGMPLVVDKMLFIPDSVMATSFFALALAALTMTVVLLILARPITR